ncbi:hypothetical protein RvY_12807 [Ramazzottius varieornatus]|uniref:Uncharacterized protein n=1 Tax=Ramazzottius varieornatus TaxID=947166 RepID=A0A1D1VPV7_RAMVA|nr:hypothetical protein RvY_12807 [Ramazzottius varieornatus]
MSSAKAVPGYGMFVRDLRKPGTVESCELPPTDQRQDCSLTSIVSTRKESKVCPLNRNDQFRPWKSTTRADFKVKTHFEAPRVPLTPKCSQRKATVTIKCEKEEDPDGRITAFHFKTSSVTTRTKEPSQRRPRGGTIFERSEENDNVSLITTDTRTLFAKEPSKRRPRGGTIFERRGENDNVSLITTDTQKLLAMLEESENEGPEGIRCGQSAKISSTRSSSESVFEPLHSNCRKTSFLRVVQKKPSPVGLSPLDRLEKRWNKPVAAADEGPEKPHSTANVPCPPTYQSELPPANAEQQNWWTRAEAHKWKERARLQRTAQSRGHAASQNTTQLPPIAHLGQLAGKPKNLTYDTDDCRDGTFGSSTEIIRACL